jgi:hypothetical protein
MLQDTLVSQVLVFGQHLVAAGGRFVQERVDGFGFARRDQDQGADHIRGGELGQFG